MQALSASESAEKNSSASTSPIDEKQFVVFITGASERKRGLFHTAHELGYKVAVIDSSFSAGYKLQMFGDVDVFIPIELSSDLEESTAQCVTVIESFEWKVDGVVTFMEMAVLLTSRVAERLNLPGHSPSSVMIARDKRRTREEMSLRNLSRTAWHVIRSRLDLDEAAIVVGFPAVLKLVGGADSIGVKRVDSVLELTLAYEETIAVTERLVVSSGMLVVGDMKADTHFVHSPPVLAPELILEEYLDGPEVDIDVLMYKGDCLYAGVSDNGKTVEPYFTETYGLLPSTLGEQSLTCLKELASGVVNAIGLSTGVFHIEAKISDNGVPNLIEINARMGGGPICDMHKRVYGVDLAAEQIRLAVGLPPSILFSSSLPLQPSKHFAYMTTNAISSGIIGNDLNFLNGIIASSRYLVNMYVRVKPGDPVIGPESGQPTWLVELWMEEDFQGGCPDLLVKSICDLSDAIAVGFKNNYAQLL